MNTKTLLPIWIFPALALVVLTTSTVLSGCNPALVGKDGKPIPYIDEHKDYEKIEIEANELFSNAKIAGKNFFIILINSSNEGRALINEIAESFGYKHFSQTYPKDLFLITYRLISRASSSVAPSASQSQQESTIVSDLDKFIASKDSEIAKLISTKSEAVNISASSTDKTIIVHVAAFVAEIDSRIEMLNQLKTKAESFRKDVDDFEKVEQIRKWLNSN